LKTKPTGPERRSFVVKELRVKTEDNAEPVITGYAAVFNSMSETLCDWWYGEFKEMVMPGAFAETILNDDIRALWNHDPNYVLGRNKANTLTLEEDEKGLKIEITPPDTQWARDLMVNMKRGDVDQMSFGFIVLTEDWKLIDGDEVRQLIKVQLFDVSPVTYPAYTESSVSVRSAGQEPDVELDQLARVVARHRRGLELKDTDQEVIRSSIEVLNKLLPATQEPVTPDEELPQTRNISVLRKRLDLIEKS
jgi:HK97 family phage prohead protease